MVLFVIKQLLYSCPPLLRRIKNTRHGNNLFGGFDAICQQELADSSMASLGGRHQQRLSVWADADLDPLILDDLLRKLCHFSLLLPLGVRSVYAHKVLAPREIGECPYNSLIQARVTYKLTCHSGCGGAFGIW